MKYIVKKCVSTLVPSLIRKYQANRIKNFYGQNYWNKESQKVLELVRQIGLIKYPQYLSNKYNEVSGIDNKPENAIIEINNTCNIDCLMCQSALSTRKKGIMNDAILKVAIQRLKDFKIDLVALHTIGDPLANPKLDYFLSIFRQYHFPIALSTNGLLLHKHIETLLRYMDICATIRFSIDGASKKVYEKIRSGGSWETLNNNLDLFKKRLFSKNYDSSITMTISKDNIFEVGKFIEHFRQYVRFPFKDITFSFVNSLSPDNSYFDKVNIFKNHTYHNLSCGFAKKFVPFVFVDGRVSVCCRDYDGSMVVGDIENLSISEMIDGESMRRFKEAHERNNLDKYPLCKQCYHVDQRIGHAFKYLMKSLLCQYPHATASFYQKSVDDFVEVFKGENNYYEGYKGLLDRF